MNALLGKLVCACCSDSVIVRFELKNKRGKVAHPPDAPVTSASRPLISFSAIVYNAQLKSAS